MEEPGHHHGLIHYRHRLQAPAGQATLTLDGVHDLDWSACLQPASLPITGGANIIDLSVRRRDRLGGILHEYEHAA